VRYGVIALGDRTYSQTFCFGGKKFDERLQGLGAPAHRRGLVPRCAARHDAEEAGHRLVPRWLEKKRSRHAEAACRDRATA
jgi:MioC protein